MILSSAIPVMTTWLY